MWFKQLQPTLSSFAIDYIKNRVINIHREDTESENVIAITIKNANGKFRLANHLF